MCIIQIIDIIDKKYGELSKSHKKLADYIKADLVEVTFMTITELSDATKISAPTITRFVRVLGYTSFADFQSEIKQIAKKEIIPVKEFKFYVKDQPVENILFDQIKESQEALANLYSEELFNTMVAASQTINSCKNIYVLGSRSTYSMAYYCYFSLKRIKENVYLIDNHNDDISVRLQYVTEDDVLIAIGYPKYAKFTIKIIQFFADLNCKVISITDRHASPLAKRADYLLVVKNRLKIYFVTTVTVINSLIVMIGKLHPQTYVEIFEKENLVTKKLDAYED